MVVADCARRTGDQLYCRRRGASQTGRKPTLSASTPPEAWRKSPGARGIAGVALTDGPEHMLFLADGLHEDAERRHRRGHVDSGLPDQQDVAEQHEEPSAVDGMADPPVGSVLSELGAFVGGGPDTPGASNEEDRAPGQQAAGHDEREPKREPRAGGECRRVSGSPKPGPRPEEEGERREPVEPSLPTGRHAEDHRALAESASLQGDLDEHHGREANSESREDRAGEHGRRLLHSTASDQRAALGLRISPSPSRLRPRSSYPASQNSWASIGRARG